MVTAFYKSDVGAEIIAKLEKERGINIVAFMPSPWIDCLPNFQLSKTNYQARGLEGTQNSSAAK